MARRRRGLTEEDRRLWEKVKATAVPLHPLVSAPPALPPPPEAPAAPVPTRSAVFPPQAWRIGARAPDPPRVAFEPPADPHASLERAHPHMDRRRFDKLRRGRMEPEARLDLHGMTSERAHAALTSFILTAYSCDLRLVLVITGKGRGDEAAIGPVRHGILRHSLPHWLAGPPLTGLILQVAPAHQRHGGAGAFYVYLRRRR